jgi:hypothetical protein
MKVCHGSQDNIPGSTGCAKNIKETAELLQSIGVRQGDNMAPLLFLFLISAFVTETLDVEWKAVGINVCTVRSILDCK